MRYCNQIKIQTKSTRPKKPQKKYTRRIIRTKSYSQQRAQRASVKSKWKVVPKDSCEIYKEKKRRQSVNERHNRKQNAYDKKREDVDEESIKMDQRRGIQKKRKKTNKKGYRIYQKQTKRQHRHRCSSRLSSYNTTSITSCSSFSDMDLD